MKNIYTLDMGINANGDVNGNYHIRHNGKNIITGSLDFCKNKIKIFKNPIKTNQLTLF